MSEAYSVVNMRHCVKNAIVLFAAVVCGWTAGHFGVSEFVMGRGDPRKAKASAESRAQNGAAQEPRMRSTVGGKARYIREVKAGPYRSQAVRVVSVDSNGRYATEEVAAGEARQGLCKTFRAAALRKSGKAPLAERYARTRRGITVGGGTGKETVALQVHNRSPRKNEPFYAFNCASVNPELLSSRFFGHEKGAFTGAEKREQGLFELANGGTLFLDEIGELPLEAQGLLLRVLEEGRFMRVGGTEEVEVDVRLITATNRNLPARVREGKFREDLFMRLNVIQLRIPPLREHKEDVRAIADNWWFNKFRKHLKDEQAAALLDYDYPGNVRELLNVLERAVVFKTEDFAKLMVEHRQMNAGLQDDASDNPASAPDELDAAIRQHVRRVYAKYGENVSKAAAALKITRNTLRKYL